jgi:xylulokinase
MHILALDVGTSSVKAAVLESTTAEPVGPIGKAAYELDYPTPDAAEVPAERLWAAIAAAAREGTRKAPDVAGIGLSILTPALVLLDSAGRPIKPIWTHLDRRSRAAARQVWAAVGEEFLATVGNRPLPGGITAVCFRQMLSEEPYLRHRVRHFLHANGWLALHLTGEPAFDRANVCFTGLFGTLTDQKWSPRWCEYFQVEPDWLPPVRSGDETVGTLRAAVAAELGVPAGIPVKIGLPDTASAQLFAGMKPSDLLHVVGTTQVLAALTERPVPGIKHLIRFLGVGPAYCQITHNPVGGVALEWLHHLCFRDQSPAEFYDRTIPAALNHPTRVTLDPPFLGGDRLEVEAHRAGFRDLTLASDRLDLLAAVLEAMRRCHRQAVVDLGLGPRFERIFLTGGAAELMPKLLPEYAEANVVHVEEGSLRGVARLFESTKV